MTVTENHRATAETFAPHPALPRAGYWMLDGLDSLRRLSAEMAASGARADRAAFADWNPRAESWAEYERRRADENCGPYSPLGGVLVQPVKGVMWAGVDPFYEMLGLAFNTDRLRRVCRFMEANAQYHTLVLDLNTPGGYAVGVAEAAAVLEELPAAREDGEDEEEISVVAFASGQCCSAGEYVASACQVKYAAPSAVVGSVGVYNYIVDSSRLYKEKIGLDVHFFADGKYKGMGAPGVPVTEEQREFVKRGVMETSAEFKGFIRRRRPGVEDEDLQGQTFPARRAPAALWDGTPFDDLEELLAAGL